MTYTILYEDDYDITNGHSSYHVLRRSDDLTEILDFYNRTENKKKYPDMFIERRYTERWDDTSGSWI